MKSHSAGVQATMGVDSSAKAMNTQTNITVVAESEELIFMKPLVLTRSGPTYPQLLML